METTTIDEQRTEAKFKAFRVMGTHGGGFASALSTAWLRADSDNRARIEAAFPELLDDYIRMAKHIEAQGKDIDV